MQLSSIFDDRSAANTEARSTVFAIESAWAQYCLARPAMQPTSMYVEHPAANTDAHLPAAAIESA